MEMATPWGAWLEGTLGSLEETKVRRSLRPLFPHSISEPNGGAVGGERFFQGPGPWDRCAVEVDISASTFRRWLCDSPSSGEEICDLDEVLEHTSGLHAERSQRLILFSGNDYLGLSTHPTVRKAASKAALEFGMGPRGSALVCGYTYYHRLLETALAELKNTQECLLCPTGFSANMAVMTAIATNATPARNDPIAIFSDALNHASIIDGIRLAQKQSNVQVQVYRHCDMHHLNYLLSNCEIERKVVVTDSLFSMDGDFAPMNELTALRKKYGFLLIIDDAHGTLICGKHGGGVAESFNVEDEVDITIGTLSKSFGCHGGFIACSQKFKQLIQSRGRSFIFSTALPVPIVAAAHAAILVAREEKWRRKAVWERVQQLSEATGLEVKSPIAAIIIGDEEKALKASRSLLLSGFHVTAIRPPTVPAHSSRLRITVSAAHTVEDIKALASAVKPWIQEQSVLPALPQGYEKDPSQASIAQNMAEQLSCSVIPRAKL